MIPHLQVYLHTDVDFVIQLSYKRLFQVTEHPLKIKGKKHTLFI